jgi:hypothetical protein
MTLNNQITLKTRVTGLVGAVVNPILTAKTTSGSIGLSAMNNLPFIRPGYVVNNNRVSSIDLNATLNVPPFRLGLPGSGYPSGGVTDYHNPVESPINWSFNVPQQVRTLSGPFQALITNCQNTISCGLAWAFGVRVGDTINRAYLGTDVINTTVNAKIVQNLGYIHSLPVSSPFYLSVQGENVRWPGTYQGINPDTGTTTVDIAQKGWWLSFKDPINLGSVDPVKPIDIAPLFPQIAEKLSDYFIANPAGIDAGDLFNAILNLGNITAVSPDISLAGNPLSITLTDLQLNGQGFATNCYGTLKFC